ncbi:MAG: hypothetical protein AB1938_08340 [Myxococcota bacterium]
MTPLDAGAPVTGDYPATAELFGLRPNACDGGAETYRTGYGTKVALDELGQAHGHVVVTSTTVAATGTFDVQLPDGGSFSGEFEAAFCPVGIGAIVCPP